MYNHYFVQITGTGHGIGRELALQLAPQGCVLVCWDIDESGNQETVKLLADRGYKKNIHAYKSVFILCMFNFFLLISYLDAILIPPKILCKIHLLFLFSVGFSSVCILCKIKN